MDIEQARFNMIEQQIRPWDVLDQAVLSLLAMVQREDFVPPEHRALAFVDTEMPLREGGQCDARTEGRGAAAAGAAGGSATKACSRSAPARATWRRCSRTARSRCSRFEIVPVLARMADDNLRRAGVLNATRRRRPTAARGAAPTAPFDVIVLSGSVAELPQTLLEQLKVGGRLVAIVGVEPVMRATLVTRVGAGDSLGEFRRIELFDTVAPRLLGFDEPPRFRF